MNKAHFAVIIFCIFAVLAIAGLWYLADQSKANDDTVYFYYGNTCPHCKNVEDWMIENNANSTLKIVQKEVYENQQNAAELRRRAKTCSLNTNEIGVPFVYYKGQCYIGEDLSIELMQQLIEEEKL